MAIQIYDCYTVNPNDTNDNIVFCAKNQGKVAYIKRTTNGALNSTTNATIEYSHSCAHSNWGYNSHTYYISMDNALRNAVNSKINSGGLIDIQNYIANIPELKAFDVNGNNSLQVFGYLCTQSSKTGSFEVNQYIHWDGDWPYNYPATITYDYDIPGIGPISDTVMLILNGWYTRDPNTEMIMYNSDINNVYTKDQLLKPGYTWYDIPMHNVTYRGPFRYQNITTYHKYNMAYYTINGIYSRNAGSRGTYNDNACDVLLNADSSMFTHVGITQLNQYLNSGTDRIYSSNRPSITNKVIMAITDVDMQNNRIGIKFAMRHDQNNSVVMFSTGDGFSFASLRLYYNFPITTIRRVNDSWGITFINDSSFNPSSANGNGASTVIWDSSNNAIVLTAGSSVNNDHGYSKIISRNSGTIQCSCANINNTIRVSIGGYSVTIPSNVNPINVRIICLNNGQIGYWRLTPPGNGYSHTFTIQYPATDDAPLVSFQNELYTAIEQSLNQPNVPFLFDVMSITDQFTINVSGLVRCDVTNKNGKTYYAISIYDVNGNFSSLLVKNGMYVTSPITVTVDIQVVNDTVLVKAGIATIGNTSTSIGDILLNIDGIAVLLPTVASVSLNGARIGYATTTVNQNSFAFSFSAQKDEVEQTDDFVSHYLQ